MTVEKSETFEAKRKPDEEPAAQAQGASVIARLIDLRMRLKGIGDALAGGQLSVEAPATVPNIGNQPSDATPQSPRNVTPEDLEAIGAVTEEDGFMPLVNTVLSGELTRLDPELRRFHELGLNPVGVLLAIERRSAQLAQIAARLGPRGSLDSLDRGAKASLGIFFREEREIRTQLKRWNRRKLERLGPKLVELHRALLGNSQAAEILLSQGLVEIARFAARR